MKNFSCTGCGRKVYFENTFCVVCGHALGFDADTLSMAAMATDAGDASLYHRVEMGQAPLGLEGQLRYCANASYGVCNWLTPAASASRFCPACDLNRTIPNLSEPGSLAAWRELERAKKRLVYSLLRFGLPLDAAASGNGRLTFDFARNTTTGHLDGVISIDILEADGVERERQRQQFDEPYRSLLGHLRHESGHFYWMVLVEASGRLDAFRALFGDERDDYAQALGRHRGIGPPFDWQARHVSAYASAHPWEDWAETWAHYLHMVDALDTAEAEGMEPRAHGLRFGATWPFERNDIYREETFDALLTRWVPLTIAMNSMSRSIGHQDYYPFVISDAATRKLAFVHQVIRDGLP